MSLQDRTLMREWQYVGRSTYNPSHKSGPWFINENLSGAALGGQKHARINFRTALWIIHGWNQLDGIRFSLVIPNPKEPT